MAKCKTIKCKCGLDLKQDVVMSKVNKTESCWLWTGGTRNRGYGQNCHRLAHRLVWEFTHGTIPDGMFVLHKCDIPACVNPDHLFLGTQADNVADMDRKGRGNRPGTKGEENGQSIYTDEQVRAVRRMYGPPRGRGARNKGITQHEVAKRLNVSRAFVHDVVNNRSWSHVRG